MFGGPDPSGETGLIVSGTGGLAAAVGGDVTLSVGGLVLYNPLSVPSTQFGVIASAAYGGGLEIGGTFGFDFSAGYGSLGGFSGRGNQVGGAAYGWTGACNWNSSYHGIAGAAPAVGCGWLFGGFYNKTATGVNMIN
jgi:hypothetical protein